MIVKAPVAMKCAFGENPKRCYKSHGISSRMTNAALIREALSKALLYQKKKEAAGDDASKLPVYDMKSEALIPSDFLNCLLKLLIVYNNHIKNMNYFLYNIQYIFQLHQYYYSGY